MILDGAGVIDTKHVSFTAGSWSTRSQVGNRQLGTRPWRAPHLSILHLHLHLRLLPLLLRHHS